MESIEVRPIRAHEWREVRALRLRALRDDVAEIAFLDTAEAASAHPDEFWITRASAASTDAGPEAAARQFVAVTPDHVWVGSVSVLLEREGATDFEGMPISQSGGVIVGVYIVPEYRGQGIAQRLLAAAVDWVGSRGLTRARLTVHVDNLPAQGAYRKSGFTPTGITMTGAIGPELELARSV